MAAIEAGVVAGYMIRWAVGKARRAAGRLDAEADAVLDAGLDRLHEVVADKLEGHPVLDDVAEEAALGDGPVSELTRQQMELAVTAAARKDEEFADVVADLVARLRADDEAGGASVVAGAGSRVFTGAAHVAAGGGGVAVGQVAGDVHVGRPGQGRADPPGPGRSRH